MKQVKDLNWLSAPAFFLIIGLLVIYAKKQNTQSHQIEKTKTELSALPGQKPS